MVLGELNAHSLSHTRTVAMLVEPGEPAGGAG